MFQNRRDFIFSAAAGVTALSLPQLFAQSENGPKLKKALKYGMIRVPGSAEDKLNAAKKVGFLGVEIDSPSNLDLDELVRARDKTGVVIHGVIDSVHWKDTLSDPDAEVRARGLKALITALNDAKKVGADTVLLVPGVARNGVTYQECWDRSSAEVKKAIPEADKLGVKIAIEVVWNDFITKPEQLVEYVDQFETDTVGAYFDVSNMLRYGVPAETWIRKLGKRMLKFDFKGFNQDKYDKKENPWVPIGEGTENWPEVLKALKEVGYNGWATAEVAGGDEKHLADVSARMDKVLQLK